jgi:hypothetical protein
MARMIRFLATGAAMLALVACGGDDDGDGKNEPSYCEEWCGASWDCMPEGLRPEGGQALYMIGCVADCWLSVEESCPEFNETACRSCLQATVDNQCIPLSESCIECDCMLPL